MHCYVECRKGNMAQGSGGPLPINCSRLWLDPGVSSYVVLFVFCFSTGKAMLAINKGLQRSVFFSLLPLRFLLIFIFLFRCVAFSLSPPFPLPPASPSSPFLFLFFFPLRLVTKLTFRDNFI